MKFEIYKSGQGYWTRLLTAVGVAVIVLGGVAWLWRQMEAMGANSTFSPQPVATVAANAAAWGKTNSNPIASISRINEVTYDRKAAPDTVVIKDGDGKSYNLTAAQFGAIFNAGIVQPDKGPKLPLLASADIDRIVFEKASITVGSATFAARNRLYIQAGVATGIILLAGAGIFAALNKPRVVDFMIATENEMAKVNWPSRREIIGATWVVICGVVLIAIVMFSIDLIFAWIFTKAGVLPTTPGA